MMEESQYKREEDEDQFIHYPKSSRCVMSPSPSHAQYAQIQDLAFDELKRVVIHLKQPYPVASVAPRLLSIAKTVDAKATLFDDITKMWTNSVEIMVSHVNYSARVSTIISKELPDAVVGSSRGTHSVLKRSIHIGMKTKNRLPKAVRTPFGSLVRGQISSEDYIACMVDLEVKLWHPHDFPTYQGVHFEGPPFADQPTICVHVPWQQRDVTIQKDLRCSFPVVYRMISLEEIEGKIVHDIDEVKMEDVETQIVAPVQSPPISQVDILRRTRLFSKVPRTPLPMRRYATGASGVRIVKDSSGFMTSRKAQDLMWGADPRDPRVKRLLKGPPTEVSAHRKRKV
eukprot:GHVH01008120.1.p1 GENE.GHVH01008120.1~~GHVH01008120.1.p1  ORF type:complete len:342 (+),score=44.18 GHVH01008120.1:50-1075(+)